MTASQSIAATTYQRARRDARRIAKTEPESLARFAADCAADLARENFWTERAMAQNASRRA